MSRYYRNILILFLVILAVLWCATAVDPSLVEEMVEPEPSQQIIDDGLYSAPCGPDSNFESNDWNETDFRGR